MLDLTGIVVSGIMMVLIVWRAAQLDRTMPWFQRISRPQAELSDQSPTAEGSSRPRRL